MRQLTYAEMASLVPLELCSDCAYEGRWSAHRNRVVNHERGFYLPGKIHWRERRVTRSGVRRFLMLVSEGWIKTNRNLGGGFSGPDWYDLWRRIEWARRTARHAIRIEIPPALWAEEQARLAAKITAAPPIPDDQPSTALLRWEKERALRWTRRSRA